MALRQHDTVLRLHQGTAGQIGNTGQPVADAKNQICGAVGHGMAQREPVIARDKEFLRLEISGIV